VEPSYTFCVLLYGNYPELARRCLDSIIPLMHLNNVELRIGMNDCSVPTQDYVRELLNNDVVLSEHIYDIGGNIHKYPRMRQMFYDPRAPLSTYVVWFDDDAILTAANKEAWLRGLGKVMQDVDIVGAGRTQKLIDQQYLWIRDQPWYKGKPVPQNHVVTFFNGGWWCARSGDVGRARPAAGAARHALVSRHHARLRGSPRFRFPADWL
jgi:hypothetical protein